jgi:hypothetical protein
MKAVQGEALSDHYSLTITNATPAGRYNMPHIVGV